VSRPEGGFYQWLVGSLGAALVVSGAALLILMWVNIIGPFRFGTLSGEAARRSVGLWLGRSDSPGLAAEDRLRLAAWRRALPDDRPIVAASELVRLEEQEIGTIVVPDPRRLADEELAHLRGLVAGGRALLVAGSIGVRGPGDDWRGYERMRRFLGVDRVVPLERADSEVLSALARGPLADALDPGQVIELIPEPGVPAVDAPAAELRWGAPGDGSEGPRGAALRVELGRGRLVWLGAGPESARLRDGEPWRRMSEVVRAALAWAAREPRVEILAWPRGAAFAAQVAPAEAGGSAGGPRLGDAALREIGRAERTGGLARLVLPGGLAGEGDPSRAPALALLERRGAWLARPGGVARWLRARSRLAARQQRVGPRRLRLDVTNLGPRPLGDGALRLYLNEPLRGAEVAGTALLQQPPGLRLQPGAEFIDLILPEIPEGATRSYHLDYDPAPAG
jgi:hypothetical protein